MSPLAPEQVVSYHKNGYLLLRAPEHQLVDPADLKKWTGEIQAWPRVKGKWMPYDEINMNGERQLMRTERFIDFNPQYKDLVCGKKLGQILKAVSDMLLFKYKINYRQPHGNGFKAHLDAPAYDHIGRIEHVTANLAIDAATIESGCFLVVPGSYKMVAEFVQGGSNHPGTDHSRLGLYATFHSKNDGLDLRERYYKHRTEMFPPEHEREEGKDYSQGYKTYGFAAPFTSIDQAKVVPPQDVTGQS
ncbi:hypothetical protein N7532_009519 [Penicillium argentinense]|uniref:Uncharacterized protein n=1 Tax=Penicillium argentinense TaxID=1131581 RepID=A0A9W9EZN5_9EURO|nr:uncharacterized protein N7532_009519 [Penicillium argentinense]KAJ5090835.1 hypothetical protein N7532_009519 [Penicillium argentinense]